MPSPSSLLTFARLFFVAHLASTSSQRQHLGDLKMADPFGALNQENTHPELIETPEVSHTNLTLIAEDGVRFKVHKALACASSKVLAEILNVRHP